MNLSVNRFNALINRVGQSIDWRPAYDCPCKNEYSGAADPNCLSCTGQGTVWGSSQTGVAAVAGQKVQREWARFGLWESGDTVLSIGSDSPLYNLGEYDRLIFSQSSQPFSITLTHQATGDQLPFPAVSISRVFWLDGAGQIVEGGIPAVDQNRQLVWSTGEPPLDQQFSITGRKQPEYFCFKDFPQDRAHQGGLALPRRVVLRRFDLFGRSE